MKGTVVDPSTVSDDILITAFNGPFMDSDPGSFDHVHLVKWDEEAPNCSTGRFYAAYELEPCTMRKRIITSSTKSLKTLVRIWLLQ